MQEMTTTVNPLLARLRIPGETFRLPSHGLFYHNGELDSSVKDGEVEVHPMTAADEIILSTPDKLLSGRAILEIFSRCIPQILKPKDLLAKDVDFLMACLRLVSFGPQLEVLYNHQCKDSKAHTYFVDLPALITGTRSIDPIAAATDFTYTVPNGQVVRMKPLTYGAVLELYQNTAMTRQDTQDEADVESMILDALVGVIDQVDDVTDRAFIREWVLGLPIAWKRGIQLHAQQANEWGCDFITPQVCKDCGEVMNVQVSANPVSFFS